MYERGFGRPKSLRTAAPSGTRLIDSIPHASTTSTTPEATIAVARFVACCDEPHWLSTVVPATWSGRPALEPRGPGDVERLLTDLAHAPADHLADLDRVDAGPVDRGALHEAEQIGRVHGGEGRRCGARVVRAPPRR